jgi:predicted  nucleic acid-binding Zn-ribbon protein
VWKFFKAESRVSELEEELTKLKRRIDAVELDWASYLDKFKRIVQRIAKRAEVVENQERQQNEAAELDLSAPLGTADSAWSRLTPRQRQIQAQIYRRRANGGA